MQIHVLKVKYVKKLLKQWGQQWNSRRNYNKQMGKAVLLTCQDSPQSWADTCSWLPSSWRWRRPTCDWRSRWQLVGQSRQRRLKLKEIWKSSAQWAGSPGWPSYAHWGHLSRKGQSQFNSSFCVALLTRNENKTEKRPMWGSLTIMNSTKNRHFISAHVPHAVKFNHAEEFAKGIQETIIWISKLCAAPKEAPLSNIIELSVF